MIFVKRGERVDAEAAALAAARHPGVVELIDVVDGALRTVRVDGRPLHELPPLAADEVAGVAAAVAATLADLHDLGVVHGGVEASHVLVGADGRIVLCSLGRGGAPVDDVAALGRMVAQLLAAAPVGPPAPHRRGRRWPRRRPARLGSLLAPPAAPELAALAARAVDPDPARRPAARELADAVHRRIPTARLPAVPAGGPVLPLPPPERPSVLGGAARGVLLAAAAVVAPVVVLGAVVVGGGRLMAGGAPAAPEPSPGGREPATTTTTATGRRAPVAERVWPDGPGVERAGPCRRRGSPAGEPGEAGPCAAPVGAPAGEAGRAPAPTPVVGFADGVVTVDGVRYAVGEPGDAVVVGDWSCTGWATAALLRPATGEVFAFDRWAEEGADVAARPVGVVEGASALRVVDADGDGCDDLAVERPGRPPVTVDVRPPPGGGAPAGEGRAQGGTARLGQAPSTADEGRAGDGGAGAGDAAGGAAPGPAGDAGTATGGSAPGPAGDGGALGADAPAGAAPGPAGDGGALGADAPAGAAPGPAGDGGAGGGR